MFATTAADAVSTLAAVALVALVALLLMSPIARHARGRRRHPRGWLRRLVARRGRSINVAGRATPQPAGSPQPTASAPGAGDPSSPSAAPLPLGTLPPAHGEHKPPTVPGRRVSDETLAPLAKRVDRSRRLGACEARVGQKLSELPRNRWLVDSYVLMDGYRVPFLVLGETGVFAIWPLDGAANPADPEDFHAIAKSIFNHLPGYRGEVQVGICRAMDPHRQPRWWIAPPARVGAWVMGLDSLIPWLEHFGTEHGLGGDDLARFAALAGPHWDRRVKGALMPSQPPRG